MFHQINFLRQTFLALVIYDYSITFDREVDLFWSSNNVTAAPALFYVTRYLGLLSLFLVRVKAVPGLSLEVRGSCY